MKKNIIFTTIITVGTGTALLWKQETRAKAGRKVREIYAKLTSQTENDVAEEKRLNMGHPDPFDKKDNEMVNEGALYTVQRYNQMR